MPNSYSFKNCDKSFVDLNCGISLTQTADYYAAFVPRFPGQAMPDMHEFIDDNYKTLRYECTSFGSGTGDREKDNLIFPTHCFKK